MSICPYLNSDELCSIYNIRPECCRNFPNKSNPKCVDAFRCDLDCKNCKDKCCKHILLTVDSDYESDFIASLNIKCDSCNQEWT